MSILASASRTLTSSLRASTAPSLSYSARLGSTNASGSSSSEVTKASESLKDLVAEEPKEVLTAEVVSGAPGKLYMVLRV